MIGDTGRSHGLHFRLHHRVGRRDDDGNFGTAAQSVAKLKVWTWLTPFQFGRLGRLGPNGNVGAQVLANSRGVLPIESTQFAATCGHALCGQRLFDRIGDTLYNGCRRASWCHQTVPGRPCETLESQTLNGRD
jgi:hypothetical protein